MPDPLFPIRPTKKNAADSVLVLHPYRVDGIWVFDDPAVGLEKEPFVAGVTEMIDRLTANIDGADRGFRLLFSASPFDGHQVSLTWQRPDTVEGNWYRADDTGEEGWLCPALFCYLSAVPPRIFVRAEPMEPTAHKEHEPA